MKAFRLFAKILLFICAALILFLPPAHGALIMTLSGTPGSSIIDVSFSGSSTAGRSSPGIINFGWDFVPATFNPFPPQITDGNFGQFTFTSGTAQITDVTRGVTSIL